MFRELKETMIKDVKEATMGKLHQIENINKETEIIKRTKWKFRS